MAGTRKKMLSPGSNSLLEVVARYIGILKDNVKKAIGLVSKTASLHVPRFFVHFFAVPAQLRREKTKF